MSSGIFDTNNYFSNKNYSAITNSLNQLASVSKIYQDRFTEITKGITYAQSVFHNFSHEFSITKEVLSSACTSWQELNQSYKQLKINSIDLIKELEPALSLIQKSELFSSYDYRPTANDIIEKYTSNSELSPSDVQYINQEVETITSEVFEDQSTENWQHRIKNKIDVIEKYNPVLVPIVQFIIADIFLKVFYHFFVLCCSFIGFTSCSANLKNDPTADAKIICVIKENSEVQILDSIPYYYKVKMVDEHSDNIQIGWLSKRNVERTSESTFPFDYPDMD